MTDQPKPALARAGSPSLRGLVPADVPAASAVSLAELRRLEAMRDGNLEAMSALRVDIVDSQGLLEARVALDVELSMKIDHLRARL